MDTHAYTSSVLEEEQEASRKLRLHVRDIEAVEKHNQTEEQEASWKLRLHVREIEAVEKHNQTQNKPKLFLDCLVYGDGETSSLGTDNKIWIGAQTSEGINFEISLCTEAPPGFSHLFLKTDDAVAVTPTSTLFCDDVKKRIRVEALASCYNAILMQTIVDTWTYPHFYHDYFLLRNDVPSPVISRLPEIPGGPEIKFGLLHQSGHYTVAVLKERMALAPARSSSIYETSVATEGPPCVCILSTSTGKWSTESVSLPDDLTSWNWHIHTVLANENSFWWVDLCCGILSYDLGQHKSVLGFIPLPTKFCLEDGIESYIREDRFVSISTGELRCVHIFRKDDLFCDYGIKSQQCEDSVKTWSWRDGQWVEDCEMKFADFWERTSYSSRGLRKFVPAYPTVDPCNHNLVNFFLPTGHRFDGHVICVHLPSMEIKYCGKVCEGLLHGLRLEIFEFPEAGAKEDQQQQKSREMAVSGKETAPTTKHRWLSGKETAATKKHRRLEA